MELSQKELAEIEGVTAKQICRRETERLTRKAKMKEENNDLQMQIVKLETEMKNRRR